MTTIENKDMFYDVIKSFDVAMLATRGTSLHARPMKVLEVTEDNAIIFATSYDSAKTSEIDTDPRALVTFQGSNKYVSSIGVIRIVTDRQTIERVWTPAMKIWFPEGMDDPSLCLLRFEISQAEIWNMSGTRGLRYIYEAARAYLAKETPKVENSLHSVVEF